MINIKNLYVNSGEKEILKNINISLELGKNYCILGKNGSGKSTLANTIMWNPKYQIISWNIELEWEDISNLIPENRSLKWLFLSFQNVPEIRWITMSEYLRTIYNIHLQRTSPGTKPLTPFVFKRFIKKYLELLEIDEKFLSRDLNVWFSWWEKRKIEMLQMKLITPKYIILDEIDSWLDLNALKNISTNIGKLSDENNSFIIITHNFKILDYINVDKIFIMKEWEVSREWNQELINEISKKWFE